MGNESPKGPFFYMQIKEVWLLKSWRSQEAMSSLQLNPRCATKLVSSLLSVLSSEAYYIELPLSLVPVYVSELTCMHGLRKKRKRVRGRNPTFRTSTHILFSRHKILKALGDLKASPAIRRFLIPPKSLAFCTSSHRCQPLEELPCSHKKLLAL